MCILVLSDYCSSVQSTFHPDNFKLGNHLTKDDFVILNCDASVLIDNFSALIYLESCPWTTLLLVSDFGLLPDDLFIPDEQFMSGTAFQICENVFLLKKEEVYTFGSQKISTMTDVVTINFTNKCE